MIWFELLAALLGALVGSTELVSRYKDAPLEALVTGPATFYVLMNAAVSALALWLAIEFHWWITCLEVRPAPSAAMTWPSGSNRPSSPGSARWRFFVPRFSTCG
jgi:hypothetical protein